MNRILVIGGAGYIGSAAVKSLIEKGVTDFDSGLKSACRGGRIEIAKLMIENGATNLNYALYKLPPRHDPNITKLLIEKGAN